MLHLRDFPVVTKIGFFAENGLFAPGFSVKIFNPCWKHDLITERKQEAARE